MRATTGTRQARVPRWLSNVPADKVFYCCSGEVYRNVGELEAGLARMSEDYFIYHVNSEKNDFSKWVQDVIEDGYLAGRLAGCQNRAQALHAVRERLDTAGAPNARRQARQRVMLPRTPTQAPESGAAPRPAAPPRRAPAA